MVIGYQQSNGGGEYGFVQQREMKQPESVDIHFEANLLLFLLDGELKVSSALMGHKTKKNTVKFQIFEGKIFRDFREIEMNHNTKISSPMGVPTRSAMDHENCCL